MDNSIKRQIWLTRYLPLVVWIGVIFFLSSSKGSFSETSRIIRPILEFLFPAATPETLTFYHGLIRKVAHFAEYAVLGVLACRAFVESFLDHHPYIFAVILIALVAILDETNQSFNPNRTGTPIDVLIDMSGGITAIVLCYFLANRRATS